MLEAQAGQPPKMLPCRKAALLPPPISEGRFGELEFLVQSQRLGSHTLAGRRHLEATCHRAPVPVLPATHWPRTGPPCQPRRDPVCATSAFLPSEGPRV